MTKKIETHTFYVNGMHCRACVILTESELTDLAHIEHAVADLKTCCVEVRGDFAGLGKEAIAKDLSRVLEKHGYHLSVEKKELRANWAQFRVAVPIALGFLALFVLLQKFGIVNMISNGTVTYSTAFVVGLVASVSTCMAVVGGLVLSVSANFAKEGETYRPQILFHLGRLIGFFFLGGVIGVIGSAVSLSAMGTFVLSVIVALVMLLLGVNLLDVFPWAKKLQPTLPRFFSKHLLELKKINHTVVPALLGVVTFVLPCGFTQSMQLYALSTGSFWSGGLTMLLFALGTFPMLAVLSFTSLTLHDKATSGVFFKTAGLVVIFFAVFNLINSMVGIGIISPVFNF